MKKRGQGNTFFYLIAAVLAILVLIIVGLIFKGQTGNASNSLLEITDKATEEAKADNGCEGIFSFNRKCISPVESDSANSVCKAQGGTPVGNDKGCDIENNQICCKF